MRTGYHAVYENNFFEAIDNANANGFEFVQFDLGVPKFFLDDLSADDLLRIRDYAKNNSVEITFHAPGDNVSLFCDYPFIRDGILKQFKMIIQKANILEARHITIHAGVYPTFKKSGNKNDDYISTYKNYYESILYENLKALILSSQRTLICLENYNFNSEIINVVNKIIKDGYTLYLTLDTAKMYTKNYQINNDVFEFFKAHKCFIREIHIHDMNKKFGSHQIVGTGIVDFTIFREFMHSDNTYMNFEIRPIESAVKAKVTLEQILSNCTK